jgi:hypothetical protein
MLGVNLDQGLRAIVPGFPTDTRSRACPISITRGLSLSGVQFRAQAFPGLMNALPPSKPTSSRTG